MSTSPYAGTVFQEQVMPLRRCQHSGNSLVYGYARLYRMIIKSKNFEYARGLLWDPFLARLKRICLHVPYIGWRSTSVAHRVTTNSTFNQLSPEFWPFHRLTEEAKDSAVYYPKQYNLKIILIWRRGRTKTQKGIVRCYVLLGPCRGSNILPRIFLETYSILNTLFCHSGFDQLFCHTPCNAFTFPTGLHIPHSWIYTAGSNVTYKGSLQWGRYTIQTACATIRTWKVPFPWTKGLAWHSGD